MKFNEHNETRRDFYVCTPKDINDKIEHYEFNFAALIRHDVSANTMKKAVLAAGEWIEFSAPKIIFK
jgi:hypothetical protein